MKALCANSLPPAIRATSVGRRVGGGGTRPRGAPGRRHDARSGHPRERVSRRLRRGSAGRARRLGEGSRGVRGPGEQPQADLDIARTLSSRYVASPTSLVISTAWAVLALLEIEAEPSKATRRGVDWLVARQDPTGDWPRDSVNGVFFGTAMLDYRLYNTYFPTWALARFEACRHAAKR